MSTLLIIIAVVSAPGFASYVVDNEAMKWPLIATISASGYLGMLPGHIDHSYSFFIDHPSLPMPLTGDTLPIRGTGRTDFQNGNAAEQYHSLFDRLLAYRTRTLVYPGRTTMAILSVR